MGYITTREASEKWGVSLRRVQDQCKFGMIPGAKRVQRDWLIPADAKRPSTHRKGAPQADAQTKKQRSARESYLTGTMYHTPGTAHAVIESNGERFAAFARPQLLYYQGKIDEAYQMLSETEIAPTLEARVGFAVLLGACALYKGDVLLWKNTRKQLADSGCENESERQHRDFWLAVYDSAIYDNAAFPQWFRMGKLSVLPHEYAPFARHHYVKHLFIRAYDNIRLGTVRDKYILEYLLGSLTLVCEPLIAETEEDGAVISEINLRLLCAASYHCAGNDAEAIPHIDRAISLALPDSLYAPLAENRTPLDLLLDERLRAVDETAYKAVKKLSERMLAGFSVLHNAALDRDYSAELTAREREASRLASYGLSNDEISARLGISRRAVKDYIQKAFLKTGAKKRAELAKYI